MGEWDGGRGTPARPSEAAAAARGGSTTEDQPRNASAARSETGDMESLCQPSPVSLASLACQDFFHSLSEVIYGCHEAASG